MTYVLSPFLTTYRAEWMAAGRPTPLEVSRSRYHDVTKSWEVLWIDGPYDPVTGTGCSTPIAEFTTWREAQDWAASEASKTKMHVDGRQLIGARSEYIQDLDDRWQAFREGRGPRP